MRNKRVVLLVVAVAAAASSTMSFILERDAASDGESGVAGWGESRLLERALTLPGGAGRVTGGANFVLPAGPRQGDGGWYVIEAHFDVEFNGAAFPDTLSDDISTVSAATNGRTFAQVHLMRWDLPQMPPMYVWGALELFHGASEGVVFGERFSFQFANLAQDLGVIPGTTNSIEVTLDQSQPLISAVDLAPSSTITLRRDGPPGVDVDVTVHQNDCALFDVLADIRSEGIPVKQMTVEIQTPPTVAVLDEPVYWETFGGAARIPLRVIKLERHTESIQLVVDGRNIAPTRKEVDLEVSGC